MFAMKSTGVHDLVFFQVNGARCNVLSGQDFPPTMLKTRRCDSPGDKFTNNGWCCPVVDFDAFWFPSVHISDTWRSGLDTDTGTDNIMGKGDCGDQRLASEYKAGYIPWELIQTHRTAESRWIVIDGCVYDVTKWSKKHPGGARIIGGFAGQDATVSDLFKQ